MVIYIEACESGSMFEGILPSTINVYATTAANAKESSYSCYYDSLRQTYLGDVYSVAWMENSETDDITKETLHQQYSIVKKRTNTSHVMKFGDSVRFLVSVHLFKVEFRIWAKKTMLVNFKQLPNKMINYRTIFIMINYFKLV